MQPVGAQRPVPRVEGGVSVVVTVASELKPCFVLSVASHCPLGNALPPQDQRQEVTFDNNALEHKDSFLKRLWAPQVSRLGSMGEEAGTW